MQVQLSGLMPYQKKIPTRVMGWMAVALLHVVMGWFLMRGMRINMPMSLPTPVQVSFVKGQDKPEMPPAPIPAIAVAEAVAISMPLPEIEVTNPVSQPMQVESQLTPQSDVADHFVATNDSSAQINEMLLVVPDSEIDYVQRPLVRYPVAAKRMKQEGLVLLSVVIDERGAVQQIAVFRSSGYPRLDEAALRAVRASLRVKPYVHNGTAISVEIRIPVEFSLSSAV